MTGKDVTGDWLPWLGFSDQFTMGSSINKRIDVSVCSLLGCARQESPTAPDAAFMVLISAQESLRAADRQLYRMSVAFLITMYQVKPCK